MILLLRAALALVFALGLLGCGRAGFEQPVKTGCTQDSQCRFGRICRAGKCIFPEELDAGSDAGKPDATLLYTE